MTLKVIKATQVVKSGIFLFGHTYTCLAISVNIFLSKKEGTKMKDLSNKSNNTVIVEVTDKKTWETPVVIDFSVDMTKSSKASPAGSEINTNYGPS